MRAWALSLFALTALASMEARTAQVHEVLFSKDGVYHIYIDIVADLNLLTAIQSETVFKRITSEVCGENDCTTRFWLSKEYAAKTADLSEQNRKSMIAEYHQIDGQQVMVSHDAIQKREAEFAEAACVKEVFNAYCLGGSSADLPPHDDQKNEGNIDRRFYGTDTAVFSVRGKVAEVIRIYSDMSWLKFRSTEGKISDIYGSANDLSYYPDYADDDSSRATAIRLERAQVVKNWQQDGWTIRWSWAKDYGRLSYTHDALNAVLEAEDPGEGF